MKKIIFALTFSVTGAMLFITSMSPTIKIINKYRQAGTMEAIVCFCFFFASIFAFVVLYSWFVDYVYSKLKTYFDEIPKKNQ